MSLFLFLFTFKLCMGSVFSKWFFLFKSLKEDAQNLLFWRFFLYIDSFFLRKFPHKCLSLFSLHLLILLSLSHFHQHFQHFRCKQLQHHSLSLLSCFWVFHQKWKKMAGGGEGGGAALPPKQDELQPHPVKDQLTSISYCATSPPPWRNPLLS